MTEDREAFKESMYKISGISNIDVMALLELYDAGYEPTVIDDCDIPYYIKLKNGGFANVRAVRVGVFIIKEGRPLNYASDISNLMEKSDTQYVIIMNWSFEDKAWAHIVLTREQFNEKGFIQYKHFKRRNYIDELPELGVN